MPEPEITLNPLCCLPSEDLALIRNAVIEAANIAETAFLKNDAKVWDKEKGHPVTDADIAVNDYLDKTLRAARPEYGWLSEETKDDHSRHACPRSFVVDPIDGTRAFIDRTPNFAVSIAVIEKGRSIAGVVMNPLKDELYEASLGGGAFLNGKALKITDSDTIENINMVGYPRKFRRLGFPDMNVSIANSMAYRICLVTSGEAHATIAFTPKSDWDVAAAALIASEAGGIITDIRGETPFFDSETTSGLGVICAGPTLHGLLLEKVTPHLESFSKGRDFKFLGTNMSDRKNKDGMSAGQLLHLVIGGELVDPNKTEFINLDEVEFVGAYPNFEEARKAWKAAAQRTVDNAHMRYFILHAHDLLDPDGDGYIG